MTRVSSLILLTAAALALASPALAKVDLNKGVTLCKAELEKQSPPPKSMRTDKEHARSFGNNFVYTFQVKQADDSNATLLCTVDRDESKVSSIAPAPAN
jgi:hypothetical protein